MNWNFATIQLLASCVTFLLVACQPQIGSQSDASATPAQHVATDQPARNEALPDAPLEPLARYVYLHAIAIDHSDARWTAAMQELSLTGDAFTLEHLSALDGSGLPEPVNDQLRSTRASIQALLDQPAIFPDRIERMLERSAWVDLDCNTLERTLPAFTFAEIKRHQDDPRVREMIERLASSYTSNITTPITKQPIEPRVRRYCRNLLK